MRSFTAFREVARHLRELQKDDLIVIGCRNCGGLQAPTPPTGPKPPIEPERPAPQVVVRFYCRPERLGDLQAVQTVFGPKPLCSNCEKCPILDYQLTDDILAADGRIAMQPRSVLGVLFFLSQGVTVPAEHEQAHLVTVTRNPDGTPFDWSQLLGGLFRVAVSKREPENAYVKVHYRSHWFFIADDDPESKATFLLLGELFNLQTGEIKTVVPALTLPLSGSGR